MEKVDKPSGLSGAGLSVVNSIDGANPEQFLKTLQDIESPESQKMILAEAMNANPKAKEALLEAMKGEYIDTNVGDGLDQIVLEKELASRELNPELKNLLKEMKQTEQSISQEVDALDKTGLTVNKSKERGLSSLLEPNQNKDVNESLKISNIDDDGNIESKVDPKKQIFVGSKNVDQLKSKLNVKNNFDQFQVGSKVSNKDVNVIEQDPRIPLKLNVNNKNKKQGKVLASGNDFVQSMNAANGISSMKRAHNKQSNVQNIFGKKIAKASNNIKGYGKAQNNIKNSMFNLSGADFNNKNTVENDFGTKLQVESVGQNNQNRGFEFIAASLDTQTPKDFDVINPNTKIMDMSNIKSENKIQIIEKIVNHIEQTKIGSSNSIDLLVKHDELGSFRVNVAKIGANQVELEIVTQNSKGREFFMQNEADLVKALDNSGVKLSNFRLVASSSHSEFTKFTSESKSQGFDMGQQTSQEQSQSKQFQSGNRDSDRRKQLWEQFKEHAEEKKTA